MQNEAVSVRVPHSLYLDLALQLRDNSDTRDPDDVVVAALKAWLARRQGRSKGGYQWKELFLPEGTELVTGSVRNPWRDIWIRRGVNECWTRASTWRSANPYSPVLAHTDRRRLGRQ